MDKLMKLTVLEFFFINGVWIVLLKALSLTFFTVYFGSANLALIHICPIQILRSLFPFAGHIVFICVGRLVLVLATFLRFNWWSVYIDISLLFVIIKIAWIAILCAVLVPVFDLRAFIILKILLILTYVTFSFDWITPFVCLEFSSTLLILVVFVSNFRLTNWIFIFLILISIVISLLLFLFSVSVSSTSFLRRSSVLLSPSSTVGICIVLIILLLLIFTTSSNILIATLSRWWVFIIFIMLSLILIPLNVLMMIVYIITIWFHPIL